MSRCPHCGRDENSSVTSVPYEINKNKQEEHGWWCFSSNFCCYKNTKKYESEIEDTNNSDVHYIRRRTIQFQLDVNNLEKRNINKPRSSILKLIENKVRVYLFYYFFFVFILVLEILN